MDHSPRDLIEPIELKLYAGDRVRIAAMHTDGTVYRWWTAIVRESIASRVVVYRPWGEAVHELTGSRTPDRLWQHVYWRDLPYNITENYGAWRQRPA